MAVKTKLAETSIIYHHDADEICVMSRAQNGGALIHPVTGSALHSAVAWVSRGYLYEPRFYRWVLKGVRFLKVFILRRAVSQGRYSRRITGEDGNYLVFTVEHFSKTSVAIPFLRRATR